MTVRSKVFFVTLLVSVAAKDATAQAVGQSETTDTFCNTVQTSIMSNTIEAQTKVHPHWQAFLESKASIDPLRNEQFVTSGPDGQPRVVSCKMKTPDHIREVYGTSASEEEARTCEAINRENVNAVIASLTPEEQQRRVIGDDQILFEEDLKEFIGVNWIKPFDYVSHSPDGALHIQSKRLQVDWTNLLFRMAPEQFRGALYCHLVAPEYIKALLLGDAEVALTWSSEGS